MPTLPFSAQTNQPSSISSIRDPKNYFGGSKATQGTNTISDMVNGGVASSSVPSFSNFGDSLAFAKQGIAQGPQGILGRIAGGAKGLWDGIGGMKGLAVGADIYSAYAANKAAEEKNAIARELMGIQKGVHLDNFGAQQSTLNTQMQDRQGTRGNRAGLSSADNAAAVSAYMVANGIKNSSLA